MSTDFLKPIISDNYALLLPALNTTLNEIAKGFDPSTTGTKINTPTGCIQWNSAAKKWQKYNGISWADLEALYSINISGNAATASVAKAATLGYFTAASLAEPKLELHKIGAIAAMWHIGAGDKIGLVQTTGNGVATGADVITIDVNTGAITAPSFIGTASQLSSTQQVNPIIGKSAAITMALGATAAGSFTARSSGAGDGNLAGYTLYHDSYATHLAVRGDGYVGIGGWSRAAWSWYTDPSGNMVAAGNVTAYSDPRLKENIRPIEDSVHKLCKLNGVHFTWRKNIQHVEAKAGKPDIGILANDVEAVFPEIVTESIAIDGERYKMVAYEKLIPVLIEAVKEQQRQILLLQQLIGS
jgi:hypothetical protein